MSAALEQKPTVAGIGNNSLAVLAGRIVHEHEAIQNAPFVVPRAIKLGNLLIEVKNHDGQYGKWATWLKENCKGMSNRTAQRSMNLADNEPRLVEAQSKKSTAEKRHTVAACRLIAPPPRNAKVRNYHDEYVAAEEKLIEKLQVLNEKNGAAAIKQAAEVTIRLLKNTVNHLVSPPEKQKVA
jgi:Protein of unknown function (DUF3102)